MVHEPPVRDPHLTRQSLLLSLKSQDPGREVAWHEFYETYKPIITGFARKMNVRPDDVEDLVQAVMLGFFSVSPEFVYDASRGRFRGYLKTCTWRTFQRKLGTQIRVGGRALEDVDPSELAVESTWNDVWESEKLRRALEIVRGRYMARADKQKTFRAFEMYTLLERTPDEVASELGMSVESVYAAKTRVSKALRDTLNEIDAATG